jgi:hypothetical protein
MRPIKPDQNPKSNKWTRQMEKRYTKQNEQDIIIDAGATSHFRVKA